MVNFRSLLIGVLATAAFVLPGLARAEQFYILYCDSGIAWRIGLHDREAERRQIELDYAQDVLNAKDDYNAAVAAANQSDDQQDMLLAANQRLQNDLQAAEDRRISRLDALYPNRWNDIGNYPDLILTGYGGPCHFCSIDIEGGSIGWLSFLLPYPGYSHPCLFGWHYGERHNFGDVRVARSNYRARYEANLKAHPRTPADLAFHNANRVVQSRHRVDQGHTQRGDINFLSNNHLPPAKTNTSRIPRATHTPIQKSGTGPPPSYVPRATVPTNRNTNTRNTNTRNTNTSRTTTKSSGGSRGGSNSGGRGGGGGNDNKGKGH